MKLFARILGLCFLVPAAAACGASSSPDSTPTSEASATAGPTDAPAGADRPEMTTADCEAKGGKVVGDIGDGAVHKPDYKCESGAAPIGRIALGIEGSVCCP